MSGYGFLRLGIAFATQKACAASTVRFGDQSPRTLRWIIGEPLLEHESMVFVDHPESSGLARKASEIEFGCQPYPIPHEMDEWIYAAHVMDVGTQRILDPTAFSLLS